MADTNTNSSSQLKVAGDINIEKIEIISLANSSTFNVTNQIITIQVFEDLFTPFITGSLIFKDSLDLINKLPFAGQEYVDIKMYTPGLDGSLKDAGIIQGRFYIYKLTEREYIGEKNIVYQLHFISAEALTDINIKISRPFQGKVSDIVSQLVKQKYALDTDKTVTIEETKSATKYVSNYWSVTKNIKFLLGRAINDSGSGTYTFFENRDGLNFVSLDYLNSKEVYQKFHHGTTHDEIKPAGGSTRNLDRDFSKVLELAIPVGFDYIQRASSGIYSSRLINHDLTTKRYRTVNYDYLKTFGETTENNKQPRLNKFPVTTDEVASRVNATIFSTITANNVFEQFGDVSDNRALQDRNSRLGQAEAFKVEIKIKGRTDYTVGQKVSLYVNSIQPTKKSDTDEDTEDKMFSGNYLVAAINHVIDKEKHECYVELIKDTLLFDLKTGKK